VEDRTFEAEWSAVGTEGRSLGRGGGSGKRKGPGLETERWTWRGEERSNEMERAGSKAEPGSTYLKGRGI